MKTKVQFFKSFAFFLIVACLSNQTAIAQLNLPAYSPRAEFSQDFALTNLTIGYGRPGVKNRKIFGEIIPFGEIWRTGANDDTIFTITDDIKVNGEKLPKGKYTILTIPGESEWKVIFNNDPTVNYTNYAGKGDVLIVSVKPKTIQEKVETFIIYPTDITDTSLDLQFEWENTGITLQLENEIETEVLAEFEQKLAGPNSSDYYSMARYLYNTDGDMDKALEYINIAIDKSIGYGNLRYKGLILAKIGRYDEAIEFLAKSRDRAATFDNKDYININNLSIKEVKAKM